MADGRAIAICKGGPLDGQAFSVTLDEQGSPPPLESRAEIVGVLYVPGNQVELSDDQRRRFYALVHPDEIADADVRQAYEATYPLLLEQHDAAHPFEAAFEYRPEGE